MGGVFSNNTQILVNRLLEKDPSKRFDSMTDALGVFQGAVQPTVTMPDPVEKSNASNLKVFISVGAVLFVIGAAIVFATIYFTSTKKICTLSTNHFQRHMCRTFSNNFRR